MCHGEGRGGNEGLTCFVARDVFACFYLVVILLQLLAESQENARMLKEEMTRQKLAHANHVRDMLRLQHDQLVAEFGKELTDRVEFEKSVYIDSLAKAIVEMDKLSGILQGQYWASVLKIVLYP